MRVTQPWQLLCGFLLGIVVAFASGAAGQRDADKVERIGMVIGIKPEKIDEYKKLHANAWPGVLKQLTEANIRNYNIYLKQVDDGKWYLFSHFEYTGDDFAADMKKAAANPELIRWCKETDPCQIPIPTRAEGEWWARMERVFYLP